MLTKGNESRYIKDQATEALNFHITLMIALLVCIPFVFIFIGVLMAFAAVSVAYCSR